MKSRRETPPDQRILRFEYELDAPPAKVWRALTVPEFVARWLTAPLVETGSGAPDPEGVKPFPSAPFSLRVMEQESCRFVRYAWREEGSLVFDNIVTFRLHPNDSGGTTFNIVHELTNACGPLASRDMANDNTPRLRLAA
ncbi:SRPBCC domain-containing protein [Methylocapsa sp. S129]|uniref:SRPBCC family protein n=1 Tax=Methylocapsa sp. S129 TaxID=1641869 RepID=UPI00131D5B0F|nr:SRPBCC domain-containing protein [Methylocapsa sp. S129]